MDRCWIKTTYWTDSFIIKQDSETKLLYLYLISNPKIELTGCYDYCIDIIEFETGLPKEKIKKILDQLEKDKKLKIIEDKILLINFLKNQTLNKNSKISFIKKIAEYKEAEIKNLIEIEAVKDMISEIISDKTLTQIESYIDKIKHKLHKNKDKEPLCNDSEPFQSTKITKNNYTEPLCNDSEPFQSTKITKNNYTEPFQPTFDKEKKRKEKERKENYIITPEQNLKDDEGRLHQEIKINQKFKHPDDTPGVREFKNIILANGKKVKVFYEAEHSFEYEEIITNVYLTFAEIQEISRTHGHELLDNYSLHLSNIKISGNDKYKDSGQTDFQRIMSWIAYDYKTGKLKKAE